MKERTFDMPFSMINQSYNFSVIIEYLKTIGQQ